MSRAPARAALRIGVLGTGDAQTDARDVPQPIRELAAAGVETELLQVPGAVFPVGPQARDISADAYRDAGTAAASTGRYAALVVNTVGDYGLAALRKAAAIPVTGSGESAIRFALQRARRFSIVTLWPPQMAFIYEHVLADGGGGDACGGMHFLSEDADLETLDDPANPISALQSCQWVAMDRLRDACARALSNDGSDTIVLGCTCMAGAAPFLRDAGITFVEPMGAGYLAAEALARLEWLS